MKTVKTQGDLETEVLVDGRGLRDPQVTIRCAEGGVYVRQDDGADPAFWNELYLTDGQLRKILLRIDAGPDDANDGQGRIDPDGPDTCHCKCGEPLDTDCEGEVRCPMCDGPYPCCDDDGMDAQERFRHGMDDVVSQCSMCGEEFLGESYPLTFPHDAVLCSEGCARWFCDEQQVPWDEAVGASDAEQCGGCGEPCEGSGYPLAGLPAHDFCCEECARWYCERKVIPWTVATGACQEEAPHETLLDAALIDKALASLKEQGVTASRGFVRDVIQGRLPPHHVEGGRLVPFPGGLEAACEQMASGWELPLMQGVDGEEGRRGEA